MSYLSSLIPRFGAGRWGGWRRPRLVSAIAAAIIGLTMSVYAWLAVPMAGGPVHLAGQMLLIGGFLVSVVVSTFFWTSSRYAHGLDAANRQTNSLKASNEQLLTQNARFETALNNMSQGLIMFDSAERLVVCNDFYV